MPKAQVGNMPVAPKREAFVRDSTNLTNAIDQFDKTKDNPFIKNSKIIFNADAANALDSTITISNRRKGDSEFWKGMNSSSNGPKGIPSKKMGGMNSGQLAKDVAANKVRRGLK